MVDSTCRICGSQVQVLYDGIFDDRHGYPQLFKISRCHNCGYCRTEPSLRREDLAAVYQSYYPRIGITAEQVKVGYHQAQQKSKFDVWLEGGGTECYRYIKPGSRVLDVGCGNCVSLLMAKNFGAETVTGIEVDPNLKAIAQELNLDVHIGHLSTLPDEKGNFDFILARQVLEHEPEPETLLAEMSSRLNAKGQIVLSFPNVDSLSRYIFKRNWLHWHVPYHISHFSKKSIELLAQKCRLHIQSLKTVTPNGWTTLQIRNMRTKIEPGQRDLFWDPGVTNSVKSDSNYKQRLQRKLANKLMRLQSSLSTPIICSLNRTLDSVNLGESFVVILSK